MKRMVTAAAVVLLSMNSVPGNAAPLETVQSTPAQASVEEWRRLALTIINSGRQAQRAIRQQALQQQALQWQVPMPAVMPPRQLDESAEARQLAAK